MTRRQHSSRHHRRPFHTTFRDINFGEDDANIEYELAKHDGTKPAFISAFYDHPQINFSDIESGRKYLVLGQKGTGKTAILRRIQSILDDKGGLSQFMIFRDEVASREELDRLGSVFAVEINDIKKIHHHFYTLERLILLILISKLNKNIVQIAASEEDDLQPNEEKGKLRSLVDKVLGKPIAKVVEVALETVSDAAAIVHVNAEKLSKGSVSVDHNVLLRKMNERLFRSCIASLRKTECPIAIFIDEIHFIYRVGHDHDQDAGLVRDLIRAVVKVNRDLRGQDVKCTIYAAIRSEFLEHPLISAAELHPYLSSYGIEVSWSMFSANLKHPMFEIGARRVDASTHSTMGGQAFMKACFANFTEEKAIDFINSTWSKPRDMIRFLRTCKDMFPGKATLSIAEYNQVFHKTCFLARKEVETALTSFLTMKGIELFTNILSKYSSQSLEHGYFSDQRQFLKELGPIAKSQTQNGSISEPATLFKLLYILGAVYTSRPVVGQKPIVHSFHRGNPNPDPDGFVAIHRGIAKSFT